VTQGGTLLLWRVLAAEGTEAGGRGTAGVAVKVRAGPARLPRPNLGPLFAAQARKGRVSLNVAIRPQAATAEFTSSD